MDKESSLLWLSADYIYPEMGGFAVAIHDWGVKTRNYEKHCLEVQVIYRCRKCDKAGETIEHVIAECSSLSESAYLRRHNQLGKIHQHSAIKYKVLDRNALPYYRYMPKLVLESANMILYWGRFTITDTIDLNRPDVVLINTENKRAFLIDIAVPLTHDLHTTEAQKIKEYEILVPEIILIWKFNNISICPLSHLSSKSGHQKLPKISRE